MNRATIRILSVAAILIVVSVALMPQSAWAAGEASKTNATQAKASPQKEPGGTNKPVPKLRPELEENLPKVVLNMKALKRLDFRIVGKTCAVCLLGIQRRLKKTPGVAGVAVMLKKPYGGVVIYDSTKLNKDALIKKMKEGEKEVKVEDPVENPVERIPPVIIPKYHNMTGIDDTKPPTPASTVQP